jgi:NADPH:quinone reductase-like Zn-dependent oxidoreductase
VLSHWAPIPPSLDFPGAAALSAAVETATRALDQLGAGSGSALLVNGASGSVGSAAVQQAVVRGGSRARSLVTNKSGSCTRLTKRRHRNPDQRQRRAFPRRSN